MPEGRAPLFVRLPAPLLERLDTHIANDGRTKQAVVEDLLASQLAAGTPADDVDEILDLPSTAALLRVDESSILERVTDGDFPARRFGDEWRISRTAVLAWLHGTDSPSDRRTGFAT